MLRRGTRTVRRNVSKEATGPSRITNSSSPSSILVPISCRTPLWRPRGGTVSLYPRWTSTVTGRMNKPSIRTAAGVIASVWAAFLLPPQLVVWSLSDTPEWMVRLASSTMYEWLTARGASVGLTHATRGLGWTGRARSWVTLAGAPLVVVSYAAEDWPDPWGMLWGAEAILFMAIGLAGLAAGVVAFRRHVSRSWATLIAITPLVVVVSTLIVPYYPHGTLIGIGLHAAAFGLATREPEPSPALSPAA